MSDATNNKTTQAFDQWYGNPLMIHAVSLFDADKIELMLSIARATFMEGAKYAASRCEADGHNHVVKS